MAAGDKMSLEAKLKLVEALPDPERNAVMAHIGDFDFIVDERGFWSINIPELPDPALPDFNDRIAWTGIVDRIWEEKLFDAPAAI